MTIHYQPDMRVSFEACMEEISFQAPPIAEQKCPHCGLIARYPVVVREHDLKLFADLMSSAQALLDRHGVMALLMAELHTSIALSKVKKGGTRD